jgi:hypothetical protein
MADVLPSIRLVSTGNVPKLSLKAGQKFHLFLSHIWSSGQDQMGAVKRELQLLHHDIKVFLDVDDLEEIGNLSMYIRQTHCVLFYLSKGYFFSLNCRKEIDASIVNRNPIILLHESDRNRGGAPLSQFKTDCPEDWREDVFPTRRPVIPWMRVKEFKLITLKMIVSSLLHHQIMKSTRSISISKTDEEMLTIPRESKRASRARMAISRLSSRISSFEVRRHNSGDSLEPSCSRGCQLKPGCTEHDGSESPVELVSSSADESCDAQDQSVSTAIALTVVAESEAANAPPEADTAVDESSHRIESTESLDPPKSRTRPRTLFRNQGPSAADEHVFEQFVRVP